MKLSEKDAEHFFNLMLPLQYFVNQRLKIHKNVESLDDYINCTTEEKFQVRQALYSDKKLIDRFIQKNPHDFSEEDLSIVSGWKDFVEGSFHIERYLKKHAILIQSGDVYGVLGLYQGFDELVHKSHLPLYVQTVLLPFKGKVIYDGLFQPYNVYFGGGVKRDLKELYMRAKQNNRIIDSFDPVEGEKKEAKVLKDWTPELKKLSTLANKLKGSADASAIQSPSFALIKTSIEFCQLAESNPEDLDNLYRMLKKVECALDKAYTVLERQEEW